MAGSPGRFRRTGRRGIAGQLGTVGPAFDSAGVQRRPGTEELTADDRQPGIGLNLTGCCASSSGPRMVRVVGTVPGTFDTELPSSSVPARTAAPRGAPT
ncbi:hypothetical protein [Streptomyces sp. NPDC005283]|uniref:hypothetical protein n=1 Tax=Streptomyces sp. NPDC005283 TaxID=3156871 RepID=UPI00345649A5